MVVKSNHAFIRGKKYDCTMFVADTLILEDQSEFNISDACEQNTEMLQGAVFRDGPNRVVQGYRKPKKNRGRGNGIRGGSGGRGGRGGSNRTSSEEMDQSEVPSPSGGPNPPPFGTFNRRGDLVAFYGGNFGTERDHSNPLAVGAVPNAFGQVRKPGKISFKR